ncbi:hypothetical protein [Streptomyces turgidiscabies]|uniref:hypothetical protein n=1 Tax=Streptomyces turgidiscabies TaxID=85558 RepID=UPI0038F6DBBF
MTAIDQTIRQMRPTLYQVSPYAFWWSLGFGILNIVVGSVMIAGVVFKTLEPVGSVPLWLWGVFFLLHGITVLVSFITKDWSLTRRMQLVGIAMKIWWWGELLAVTVDGFSPFLLIIWSFLIYLQGILWAYWPRVSRD